jgi:hypothetical protein
LAELQLGDCQSIQLKTKHLQPLKKMQLIHLMNFETAAGKAFKPTALPKSGFNQLNPTNSYS